MMYGDYYFPGEELDQMAEGGIPSRYKNMGFSKVGVKKKSTRPGKKWMVLAKKGDKYKVVHGGDSKMKDFSQHGSEKRKDRFWDRMGGKDSAKANDPFSPLYWHKKFGTWQKGGEANPMDVIKSGIVPAGAPRGEFNIVPPFEDDPNLRRHMFNFPQDYNSWRTFAKNAKSSPEYFIGRGLDDWRTVPDGRASSDYVNQQLKYSAGKNFPSVRLNGWADGGEPQNAGFQALPPYVQAKIMANMMYGGDMYAMGGMPCYECGGKIEYADGGVWFNEDSQDFYQAGGQMIRRADGSYSRRGLWDNIRANRGSGKKPTKEMLEQEAKIKKNSKKDGGIHIDPAKRGTFKAMATRMGMSVQEAAAKILNAPEGKYSPEMRRKANFARNFAKQDGGPQLDFSAFENMEPIMEIPTDEQFKFMPGKSKNMYATENFVAGLRGPKGGFNPYIAGNLGEDYSYRLSAGTLAPLVPYAAVNVGSWLGKNNKEQNALRDIQRRTFTDNLYSTMPAGVTGQRGDYDVFGNFRPDETLASRTYMGEAYAQMGGEIEMTDDQIRQLVALGAEIEILD